MYAHRVLKLVNFSRFARGPSVDSVFNTGVTWELYVGVGNAEEMRLASGE